MKSIACVACLGMVSLANAQLLNGNFESPNDGYQSVGPGQTLGSWTCSGPGDIEYVEAITGTALHNLDQSAYEGRYWIDLCGVGAPSGISQDIGNLSAGELYSLSFAQAGNVWGDAFEFGMNVLWNNEIVATYSTVHGGSDGANMEWRLRQVDVTAAAGINRLEFRALTGIEARGAAIDDVRLVLVPAPATLGVISLAGLAAVRRRR